MRDYEEKMLSDSPAKDPYFSTFKMHAAKGCILDASIGNDMSSRYGKAVEHMKEGIAHARASGNVIMEVRLLSELLAVAKKAGILPLDTAIERLRILIDDDHRPPKGEANIFEKVFERADEVLGF